MFGIDSGEFVVIAIVALVVIGPKDLPRVLRVVGQWVGKARAMSRHVRSGFDTMMREAELEEMQKQWDAQNAAIIASTRIDLPHVAMPDLDAPATPEVRPLDAPHMLPLDAQPMLPDAAQPVAEAPMAEVPVAETAAAGTPDTMLGAASERRAA